MEFIEAAETDCDSLVALWQACGLTRPWNDPLSDFRLAFNGPTSAILVARNNGLIVGSVMTGFDGHRGWVYYLAVQPDQQGLGLGRKLMGAAENWLRQRGAPKIQLMVRADNDAALDFYDRLGFERQNVVTLGRFITTQPDEF